MLHPSERAAAPLRVVLDTNVLVSVLLYQDSALAWLAPAWGDGSVVPLIDQQVIDELSRILLDLGARKFHLDRGQVEAIIAHYVSSAEAVPADSSFDAVLPKCKDPDDQKFLELAQRGNAHVLVTNDGALLGLGHRTRFLILSASKFRIRAPALLQR